MNSDISCGKKNIYLDKLFNEKIERFLDNLFDYANYSVAIETNAFFFKEMLSITPQLLSSISPTTQYWYIETSVGIICCELHTNSYGEWAVLLKNISFYSNYMRMFQMKPKELGLVPHSSPLSFNNNSNKKYRVIGNAGYGLQIVKGEDGTFNYINSDGKLLYPRQWFKEVKPFKKTKQGILAFVNNNGICNAIDSNGTIYDMNRAWKDCFTEGKIKKDIMTEAINKISQAKRTIRLMELESKGTIAESVRQIVRTLNEKKEDHSYKPIGSQTFYTNNGKIERKSIVTLQSPSGQVCHIAEDDHCYVLFNGSGIDCGGNGLNDKNCEMIHYIFPEAFKALKELPLL